MPQIFLETIAEDDIQITGADAHHIGYALRMRPGEHLTVCANNIDYDCAIREITKDTLFFWMQYPSMLVQQSRVYL